MKSLKTDVIIAIILICIMRLVLNIMIAVNLEDFGYVVSFFLGFFLGIIFLFIQDLVNLFKVAPKVPEIQYAKFPFEIVYSVDGEIYEVKDVFVCEYKGIGHPFDGEKELEWQTYIESSGERDFELFEAENRKGIYIDLGNEEYYMMGKKPYDEYVPGEYLHDGYHKLNLQEAKEQLGIEIISAKLSDPIENEFEYRAGDKIRMFLTGGGED